MTTKLQAITAGWVCGITSFVSWLVNTPPEQQSGILAMVVDVVPVTWRPAIGLGAKILATVSTIYGIYKASHSGPTTPPQNKPV